MIQEILDAGWKSLDTTHLSSKFKDGVYEKGNYWLVPNEIAKQIIVHVHDPVDLLNEGWAYPENFKLCIFYSGPKVLEGLDKLLNL